MTGPTLNLSSLGVDAPAPRTVRAPAWLGLGLFVVIAPAHLLLNQVASIALAAVTLAVIGGTYIGFGATDGRRTVFWSELSFALLVGPAALLGLLWHWAALPLGLVLHALWDVIHHNAHKLARVQQWYIPFCVVFDLLAAGFLTLLVAV